MDYVISTKFINYCKFRYYNGRKLIADLLKDSPKTPNPYDLVMWEIHSTRMKRRIERILQKLRNCITNSPMEKPIDHLINVIDATNLTNVFNIRNARNITNITIVTNVTVVTQNATVEPTHQTKKSSIFPFSIFDQVHDFFKNIFGPPMPLPPLHPLPELPALDELPDWPELQIESPLKVSHVTEAPNYSDSMGKVELNKSKETTSEVLTIPISDDL